MVCARADPIAASPIAAASRRLRLVTMAPSLPRPVEEGSCFRAHDRVAVYMRPRAIVRQRQRWDAARGKRSNGMHRMERTRPPFRADHVGSLIRPDELIKAREQAEKNEISSTELARIQQAAIRDVVRLQEELGLKLVTDGEYNRHSWHRDFMLKFRNVRMIP